MATAAQPTRPRAGVSPAVGRWTSAGRWSRWRGAAHARSQGARDNLAAGLGALAEIYDVRGDAERASGCDPQASVSRQRRRPNPRPDPRPARAFRESLQLSYLTPSSGLKSCRSPRGLLQRTPSGYMDAGSDLDQSRRRRRAWAQHYNTLDTDGQQAAARVWIEERVQRNARSLAQAGGAQTGPPSSCRWRSTSASSHCSAPRAWPIPPSAHGDGVGGERDLLAIRGDRRLGSESPALFGQVLYWLGKRGQPCHQEFENLLESRWGEGSRQQRLLCASPRSCAGRSRWAKARTLCRKRPTIPRRQAAAPRPPTCAGVVVTDSDRFDHLVGAAAIRAMTGNRRRAASAAAARASNEGRDEAAIAVAQGGSSSMPAWPDPGS